MAQTAGGGVKMEMNYSGRIYHDKAVKEKILKDLKAMCGAVLCGRELDIRKDKDGYDMYPSCKSSDKKYCHCKKKKYMGYVKPGGYMVFADSEIGVYCRVIEMFAGNEIIVPFSAFPSWKEDNI